MEEKLIVKTIIQDKLRIDFHTIDEAKSISDLTEMVCRSNLNLPLLLLPLPHQVMEEEESASRIQLARILA